MLMRTWMHDGAWQMTTAGHLWTMLRFLERRYEEHDNEGDTDA